MMPYVLQVASSELTPLGIGALGLVALGLLATNGWLVRRFTTFLEGLRVQEQEERTAEREQRTAQIEAQLAVANSLNGLEKRIRTNEELAERRHRQLLEALEQDRQ